MSANKLFIILLNGLGLDDQYEEPPKCSEMLNKAKSLDPPDQYASLCKDWILPQHLRDFRLEMNDDELFCYLCCVGDLTVSVQPRKAQTRRRPLCPQGHLPKQHLSAAPCSSPLRLCSPRETINPSGSKTKRVHFPGFLEKDSQCKYVCVYIYRCM